MLRKGLAVAAILGFLMVAALWLERRTEVALPTPTGPLAVGRAVYDWADSLAPDAAKRELLVWIWYPAAAGQTNTMDDYLPTSARPPAGRGDAAFLFRLLTRDVSKVHGHSMRSPAVSTLKQSYPVVILRAGASLRVMDYSTLAEDLASHGYIVVGFDAPYRTRVVVFPDGRVLVRTPENDPELVSGEEFTRRANKLLAAWTADIAFVLDQLERWNASDAKFAGRLDMTRVGVFGHSFGGATAAQFCSQDARCKAGIDVDGSLHGSVIETGIQKPFLFLLSGHGDFSSDAETRQILAEIQSVYDRLPPDGKLRVTIRGANHFMFSDDGAVLKSAILRRMLRLFGAMGIDGRRQLAVTSYCIHTFFDAYLKGGAIPPRFASPLYPEVQVFE